MLVNTRAFTLACAAVTWVAACSSGSDDEVHACDPLATTASSVEFDLAADDGKRVVVISTTEQDSEHLFYGTPPTLTEYPMINPGYGKDACGDFFFDFDAEGQAISASLWGVANIPRCATAESSRLTIAKTEIPLHQTGTKAAGLTYMCR